MMMMMILKDEEPLVKTVWLGQILLVLNVIVVAVAVVAVEVVVIRRV
jgi:hypothetical protein